MPVFYEKSCSSFKMLRPEHIAIMPVFIIGMPEMKLA